MSCEKDSDAFLKDEEDKYPRYKEAMSYEAKIFVAGDIVVARHLLRKYCMKGLCVSMKPTEFIYTGGLETGIEVTLINYPKFPRHVDRIWDEAVNLAKFLREKLCQRSVLVQDAGGVLWLTDDQTSTKSNES